MYIAPPSTSTPRNHTTPHHPIPEHTPHHFTSPHITSHHIIACHSTSYHIIPHDFTPSHTELETGRTVTGPRVVLADRDRGLDNCHACTGTIHTTIYYVVAHRNAPTTIHEPPDFHLRRVSPSNPDACSDPCSLHGFTRASLSASLRLH